MFFGTSGQRDTKKTAAIVKKKQKNVFHLLTNRDGGAIIVYKLILKAVTKTETVR